MTNLYDLPPEIQITAEGELRIITLNRPNDLNASARRQIKPERSARKCSAAERAEEADDVPGRIGQANAFRKVKILGAIPDSCSPLVRAH